MTKVYIYDNASVEIFYSSESFIHSTNIYWVPSISGHCLSAENREVNSTDKIPSSQSLYFNGKRQTIDKEINKQEIIR